MGMKPLTSYEIVTATKPEDLAEKVNEKLADGMKLVGGVSIAIHYGGITLYAQALI